MNKILICIPDAEAANIKAVADWFNNKPARIKSMDVMTDSVVPIKYNLSDSEGHYWIDLVITANEDGPRLQMSVFSEGENATNFQKSLTDYEGFYDFPNFGFGAGSIMLVTEKTLTQIYTAAERLGYMVGTLDDFKQMLISLSDENWPEFIQNLINYSKDCSPEYTCSETFQQLAANRLGLTSRLSDAAYIMPDGRLIQNQTTRVSEPERPFTARTGPTSAEANYEFRQQYLAMDLLERGFIAHSGDGMLFGLSEPTEKQYAAINDAAKSGEFDKIIFQIPLPHGGIPAHMILYSANITVSETNGHEKPSDIIRKYFEALHSADRRTE